MSIDRRRDRLNVARRHRLMPVGRRHLLDFDLNAVPLEDPGLLRQSVGAKPVQPLIASVTLGTSAQAEAVQNTAASAAAKAPIHRLAIVKPSCHSSSAALVVWCGAIVSMTQSLSQRTIAANPVLWRKRQGANGQTAFFITLH
jgi:hypothetical protein